MKSPVHKPEHTCDWVGRWWSTRIFSIPCSI